MIEFGLDEPEGFLGVSVFFGDTESPVFDLSAVGVPVIGEAVDDDAGQTASKREFDLPREQFGLPVTSFADGVDAAFT